MIGVHTANCLLHNLETVNEKPAICQESQVLGMYCQTDLSTKNKVSIVSEEFYGLPAEFYESQRPRD